MSMSIFKTIAKALIFNNSKIENINKQVDKHSKSIKDLKKLVSTSDLPTIELDLKILNLSDLDEFNSNVDVTPEIIREFLGFESEMDFLQNLTKLNGRKFIIKLMDRWNFNGHYFEVYSSSICSGRVMEYGSTNIFMVVIPFYDSNGDQYELYFQTNDYSQTGFFSITSRDEVYSKFATDDSMTNLTNEIIANEEVTAAAITDINTRLDKSISDINRITTSGINSLTVNGVNKTPSNRVVDLGYTDKQLLTSTSSSMTLSPNIYYRNTSTSLSTLTITLGSASNSNIINEYFVEFTTSSSGTTVSLPSTIKWANGEIPTFEASTTYQISIVNHLGVVTKFE